MRVVMAIEEPRRAPRAGIALFEYGFRVFFLLAGLQAAVGIALWVPVYLGWVALPAEIAPSLWHAHEMVFGFAVAGIAGFLLTTVPNWTATPARRGPWLVALAGLWLAGRLAMAAVGVVPSLAAAAIELAFLPALALTIVGPLIRAKVARNLALLLVLLALWGCDAAMQAGFLGWSEVSGPRGARLGIDALLLLITVIGGRIIPAFTSNGLQMAGIRAEVRSFVLLDRAVIATMAALIMAQAATGQSAVTGTVALLAAVLQGVRLAGWRGNRTLGSPILWVLHLGYAWLVVGLALKGAAAFADAVPEAAGLHALTAGAVATMLVAVMSRAALGHTGRPLKAHPPTVAAYALISVATLLRVAAACHPMATEPLLIVSGAAWTLAFLLFLLVYAPILILPRVDGKPG